jgi:anti-sigma factor NepR-like protein
MRGYAISRREGGRHGNEAMKERTRQAPEKSMPHVESCEDSQESLPSESQPSQEKKHVNREKARGRREKGQLSQDIQRRIGLQLRAMYADVVNEGVPDRFADLLRRLDKQDKQ